MRLILASASPRRAELLRAAGFDFEVIAPDIDESILAGEEPERYARRVAEAKARAVFSTGTREPVLAADTVVVVDGTSLGKPADQPDAARMLRMLSGGEHAVVTAVCLMVHAGPAEAGYRAPSSPAEAGPHDNRRAGHEGERAGHDSPSVAVAGVSRAGAERLHIAVARTVVTFAPLSDAEIAWYVGTGEPRDKAGAYAVQGLASRFVTRIDGSYSNVVGLPVAVVSDLCKQAGLLIC